MALDPDIAKRFRAITHKLWGEEKGEEFHTWIIENRPTYFQEKIAQVMVPIWEMDNLDLKTKILVGIGVFTALHRDEVEFFIAMAKHHNIPQIEIEEVLLLTGLEAGFPNAEHAILLLKKIYMDDEEYSNK